MDYAVAASAIIDDADGGDVLPQLWPLCLESAVILSAQCLALVGERGELHASTGEQIGGAFGQCR